METTNTTPPDEGLRTALADGVATWKPRVRALSEDLHANPEISFEEVRAAEAITSLLSEGGFDVTQGTAELAHSLHCERGKR